MDNIFKNRKLVISLVIILLLIYFIYAILPFISAIFGAIIFYLIFEPLNKKLTNNLRISKRLSAGLIIALAIILIIIPVYFIVQGLIKQISMLPEQLEKISELEKIIESKYDFEINIDKEKIIGSVIDLTKNLITPIFTNIVQIFLILFLMFFLLFYLLAYNKEIKDYIYEILPFEKKDKKIIIKKFYEVTYSGIIGTFLISIMEGFLVFINFYLLNIPNSIFWGLVTLIFGLIPILGPPFILIPAIFIMILTGNIAQAIVLVFLLIMLIIIENILRPIINQRYGSIHPVISILGLFIGISKLGIMGIFIGPLIVSYLVLFWNMFKEKYI